MELVLLLLLLGEDMDGRLWLRKTPGAMGCGPPDFTVPVLNSWSVRLPSWESRLCSGELLSWDLGSSITIAFFLVLFFFFLVFCCSSFWNKFLSQWATQTEIGSILMEHFHYIPDVKALLQLQPAPFRWRPLGLHLSLAARVEEPTVQRVLWWHRCRVLQHVIPIKLANVALSLVLQF